jgi:hypothetical protein
MHDQREFDIDLSLAVENRDYVDQVANLLRNSGVRFFYDLFDKASLLGKNLYDYLSDIYTYNALYNRMLISKYYSKKLCASHERQSMQIRVLYIKGSTSLVPFVRSRYDC